MTDEPVESEGAEPSIKMLYDTLRDIEADVADGSFRSLTAYEGSTPLLSVVPHRRRILHADRPAPLGTPVRLSRFAYLHRAEREIRLETPVTSAYAVIHDPRAAALLGALAFDATPEALAGRVGLSIDATASTLGLLQAIGVVNPVEPARSEAARYAELLAWVAEEGVAGEPVPAGVLARLAAVPTDRFRGVHEMLWERHHDGSNRLDVSILEWVEGRTEDGLLLDPSFIEYDVVDGALREMGRFDQLPLAPITVGAAEQLTTVSRALDLAEDLGANPVVVALAEATRFPTSIGRMSGRSASTRVLMPVISAGALARAGDVLRGAGVDASVIDRLPLLEPLLGGVGQARLAVDAIGTGIGPRIGLEVFDPQGIALVPGVLDALGVDPAVVTSFAQAVAQPVAQREITGESGAVLDTLVRKVGHVKVTFDGSVAGVKSYHTHRVRPTIRPGGTAEDTVIPATWEFHDLLFHTQTRDGRVRHRIGGTARFQIFPFDTVHTELAPWPGDIVLPPVDVAAAVADDPPFGEVMRERVSSRAWSDGVIPLPVLAELLARVMEARERPALFPELSPEPITTRAFPSGGGIYETDLVVIANRVDGLERGAYLYRPASNSLGPLVGVAAKVEALLGFAGEATGGGVTTPDVLLICAARFPDLAVKYEGIAYALMAKHVGVLMEAIALTATAMGLGACPLGTGNADDFAAATGLDYYRHGSTGEIALSMPVTDR